MEYYHVETKIAIMSAYLHCTVLTTLQGRTRMTFIAKGEMQRYNQTLFPRRNYEGFKER